MHSRYDGNFDAREDYSIAHNKSNRQLIYEPIEVNPTSKDTFLHKTSHQQNEKHERNRSTEVYGYMTLNEVARKYNVPANELALCIHVPEGRAGEKLGRLKKQYDFHLNDLREYIESKQNKNDN